MKEVYIIHIAITSLYIYGVGVHVSAAYTGVVQFTNVIYRVIYFKSLVIRIEFQKFYVYRCVFVILYYNVHKLVRKILSLL